MVSQDSRNQECNVLAAMKKLPFDALLAQARKQYKTKTEISELEMALNGMLNETDPTPVEYKIAELLYFRSGHLFVENMQYNSLTRLQLEHACLFRALLTPEQLPISSDLALRIVLKADREQIQPAEKTLAFGRVPPSRVDSGYFTKEEDVGCSDDESCTDHEDSEDEHAIYIRSWNPRLGRTITYRY
jgi:hypothetical protein